MQFRYSWSGVCVLEQAVEEQRETVVPMIYEHLREDWKSEGQDSLEQTLDNAQQITDTAVDSAVFDLCVVSMEPHKHCPLGSIHLMAVRDID